MHNYVGANTYQANIRIVDDSDPPNAANLMAGVQDLADRTTYLHTNSILSTGGHITGALFFDNGSVCEFTNGSSLFLQAGSLTELDSGATFRVDGGALVELLSGAVLQLDGGSHIDANGADTIRGNANQSIVAQVAEGISSETPGGISLRGGATDWIGFNPAKTKQFTQSMLIAGTLPSPWAGNGALVGGNTTNPVLIQLPFVHDGATLQNVIITFQVALAHANAPTPLPTLDIRRRDMFSATLADASLGGGPLPFPNPGGTGPSWYNGGNAQVFTYVLTPGATAVIDNRRYLYFAVLTDEDGGNAHPGNIYWSLELTHVAIADSRFAQ